jgi:DNA-binding beta-propeller fold protein YncE
MATEEGIRRSAQSRRSATFKNLVRIIPAIVIIAATLNTLSCGDSGLLSRVNGNGSATATSTAGAATLAFVTQYADGKVSWLTRNTTTGALTAKGQTSAGKKNGPRGLVAAPGANFLYVANINDNNIYEYSVNSTNGALTPLSPASVSNGNGTQPDELAINPNGTLLWATGRAGTVTAYTINTGTGQLTSTGPIGGFNTPFGIAVHPTLPVIYVSDLGTGLIWPMTYNTSTGALTKNLTAVGSADPNAVKPAAIAIDSGGDALFTPDEGNGEVSSFVINTSTGALTPIQAAANSSVSDAPLGIGIGTNTSVEYVFTGNFGSTSISSFIVTTGPTLVSPPTLASGYNAPKGLVVDPQNVFVYTADSGDGTVGMATINGSCGSQLCAGSTFPSENPANASGGPFMLILAQ